ncbi:hypothetical protein S83_005637 [Arachis hypogaea]
MKFVFNSTIPEIDTTNLYHDMYKGLDEFNMSLQRYNSLLKSDLEAANEAQRKLEIEIASNFGGGPHVVVAFKTTSCNDTSNSFN